MPANSRPLPSKMVSRSEMAPRKYSSSQAAVCNCLATAQVDMVSDLRLSYSKKNSAAHRLKLPSASASISVFISMAIDACRCGQRRRSRDEKTPCAAWPERRATARPLDLVFDVAAAVADLTGPGLGEEFLFVLARRGVPEHDQRALVVVQLGEFFDEALLAGGVGQRHRVTVDARQPLQAIGLGEAVGGGQRRVV